MLWHGKRETGVDAFKLATSIFAPWSIQWASKRNRVESKSV